MPKTLAKPLYQEASIADPKKRAKQEELQESPVLITKISLGAKLTIGYQRPLGAETEKCSVDIEEVDNLPEDLTTLLNQFCDDAIEAKGLDQTLWKDCSIVGVGIKYDGRSISGARLTASHPDFGDITTRFLKVLDHEMDQVRLEHLCCEVQDILNGKRHFEQGDLFEGGAIEDE